MPIIYTYPKLTNPIGNELIVITDVNDKKFTKQITLAAIAGLIPTGTGCGTAINEILDGDGAVLYTAPACSPMSLTSLDGSVGIASNGSGVDLSTDTTVPCAGASIGGIIASTAATGIPPAAEGGTYYPVQITTEGCTGVVRIPDAAGISCASSGSIGGIKVDPSLLGVIPSPSAGTTYPVQVDSNCQAGVIIPDPATYTLPCPQVLGTRELGGIKVVSEEEVGPPEVAAEGSYYPLSITTNQATQQDNCVGIVKIPDNLTECATSAEIGGIKVNSTPAVDAGSVSPTGTNYPVQVTSDCVATVRVPSSGGGGGGGVMDLLRTTVYETTVTTPSSTSLYPIPERISGTTPFGQVQFTPGSSGSGSAQPIYGYCIVPSTETNYVRVVVKFSVLKATSADEKIAVGLHNDDSATIVGSTMAYGWQSAGDMDSDATSGMIVQYKFTWDIVIDELLTLNGDAAVAGNSVYFFLKILGSDDTMNLMIGKQWKQNLTGLINSNEAAEPVVVDVFEISSSNHSINPGVPA